MEEDGCSPVSGGTPEKRRGCETSAGSTLASLQSFMCTPESRKGLNFMTGLWLDWNDSGANTHTHTHTCERERLNWMPGADIACRCSRCVVPGVSDAILSICQRLSSCLDTYFTCQDSQWSNTLENICHAVSWLTPFFAFSKKLTSSVIKIWFSSFFIKRRITS